MGDSIKPPVEEAQEMLSDALHTTCYDSTVARLRQYIAIMVGVLYEEAVRAQDLIDAMETLANLEKAIEASATMSHKEAYKHLRHHFAAEEKLSPDDFHRMEIKMWATKT